MRNQFTAQALSSSGILWVPGHIVCLKSFPLAKSGLLNLPGGVLVLGVLLG